MTQIEQLREKIRQQIKGLSDSKEDRARKGAYADCLVMLNELPPPPDWKSVEERPMESVTDNECDELSRIWNDGTWDEEDERRRFVRARLKQITDKKRQAVCNSRWEEMQICKWLMDHNFKMFSPPQPTKS